MPVVRLCPVIVSEVPDAAETTKPKSGGSYTIAP